MSKKINLFAILVLSLMVMFTISCEGPAGADGVAGADGTDGTDGVDGADGNVSCLTCHSTAGMDAINGQFALSGHSAGNYVGYAGSRGSCSRCHSSEGFMDFIAGYGGEDIPYPSAWSCGTCHGSHSSLEEGIEAPLQTTAAVTIIEDGTTVIDFSGPSNLCANCHQSRRGYAYYEAIDSVSIDGVLTEVGAGNVAINSSHAGPHHGPQANTLSGLGGYGTSSTGAHLTAGCVGCHMGDATATEGGHSFVPNLENCTVACHSSVTDMAAYTTDAQDAVSARLTAIAGELVTAGALSLDEGEYHPHVGIVTEAQFKAFWNYMVVYEDHSHGVHNPGYFNTLLTQAEALLGL
ncbi:MAG: hypothetical protein H8E26_10310 [FCB group bacterium]|nr:hypothetical protein [FCB group bacterium]MBL7120948.1 hypothetical protein [Candidatus Neomarinimicrobiota bacterium]